MIENNQTLIQEHITQAVTKNALIHTSRLVKIMKGYL